MSNPVQDFPWEFSHAAATKLVHTGKCVLHTITVNHFDAADVSVSVYDGVDAGGVLMAVVDVDGGKTHYVNPATLLFDCKCDTGIYCAFSGSPSGADITVTFK